MMDTRVINPRAARAARTPAAPRRGQERQRLIGEIAALTHPKSGDLTAFRQQGMALISTALDDGRAEARRLLEAGGKGLACAERLSDLEDDVIAAIHALALRELGGDEPQQPSQRMTVAAVGGYGRGALAPGSDIDLLFLLPTKPTPSSEKLVETMLYMLWDLRQKVGHSTRSIGECIRQAKADMTIRTSLLEARFILGDEPLFDEMRKRFDAEIVAGSAHDFVAAKLAERDERLKRAGGSRYLVEPNVKDGKGGIRDLNTLFWIGKYVYRVGHARDLVDAGLFDVREFELFRRCEEFLWAVRCHLHFLAGRAEDRLSFDFQRPIAELLGYTARFGLTEVERFMKHYFLIAKDVGDLTAIVCAALEEKQAKPRATLDRFIGRLRRRSRVVAGAADFVVDHGRISVINNNVFERDPTNLIRLYWAADRSGLAIHPNATRLVTKSLKRIDAKLRNDPEANRLFLEVLTSRRAPETVLRRMNEAGVLGRFIPEFGRIVGMMQFSMYHHYTVDEHLLRTIGVLAEIHAGAGVEEHPLASEFLPNIANPSLLYVAAFLHDIAKGRPEDHSIAGAEVARRLCPRLGLSAGETETVAWLVLHHLDMSMTAQSRDLSDPRTVEGFAAVVQTLERLRLLLVLTICDIKAVGPAVWNGWKGQLLRTLFWETEMVLSGGHSTVDRKSRVAASQEELRKALPGWSDPEFEAYAARHYQAYWLRVDLPHRAAHAKLLHAAAVDMRSLTTEVTTDAFRGVTELTVVASDHPRLLSIIAGACAASGGNIVDAQIFTTTDGLALDTISLSRAFDRDEDELRRARRIAQGVEDALRGKLRLGEAIAAKRKPDARARAFAVTPEVTISNALSNRFTVIEISGLDRPGLLYELTSALSNLNLNIGSAHVVTFGEKAVDSFYVTDLTGLKIAAPARQAAIKRHILAIFDGAEDKKPISGQSRGGA
jgi:[protein-PII] uridylyltransferase